MFIPIWGRFPFWLIFFKWVETTKQVRLSPVFFLRKNLDVAYSFPSCPFLWNQERSFKNLAVEGDPQQNSLRGRRFFFEFRRCYLDVSKIGVFSPLVCRFLSFSDRSDTVDGRNPAPPGMYKTMKMMGYLPYQLVQDFFHQQYVLLTKDFHWFDVCLQWDSMDCKTSRYCKHHVSVSPTFF